MLDALEPSLRLPPALIAAYLALRQGVDYTQNPIAHGGHADGSILPEQWIAARDLAVAFERLERALKTFLETGDIPF